MEQRILLGIDQAFSPATQQAIMTAGALFRNATPSYTLYLLHVIPTTQISVEHPGYPLEQQIFPPTPEQYKQAETVLQRARTLLERQSFPPEQVEVVVKTGTPVEEIIRTAKERQVQLIVVGSRGSGWRQRLRRTFIGSISRTLLKVAPCPVMVVTQQPQRSEQDLVDWYEQAVRNYLQDHPKELTVLTPEQVALYFHPSGHPAEKEDNIQVATLALQRLELRGVLCRHESHGVIRYVND